MTAFWLGADGKDSAPTLKSESSSRDRTKWEAFIAVKIRGCIDLVARFPSQSCIERPPGCQRNRPLPRWCRKSITNPTGVFVITRVYDALKLGGIAARRGQPCTSPL